MCNAVNFIVLVIMGFRIPNSQMSVPGNFVLFSTKYTYFPVENSNFNFLAFPNGGAIARFVLFLKAPSILSNRDSTSYHNIDFLLKHKLIAKSFKIETIN